MKYTGMCLLLAAWAGTGCVTPPAGWETKKPPPVTPVAASPRPPRKPVRADQVTDETARKIADDLDEEIERALHPES